MSQIGKFASLSAFLESYKAAEKRKAFKELLAGPPGLSIAKIKKEQKKEAARCGGSGSPAESA